MGPNVHQGMIALFLRLCIAISSDEDLEFLFLAFKKLIFETHYDGYLMMPAYSFAKPAKSPEFLFMPFFPWNDF